MNPDVKQAPQPTPRLREFHIRAEHPLPPPLHRVGKVDCDAPADLAGWGVHIRGATMFLVSPAGWKAGRASGKHQELWDRRGARHIYGPIPLANVTLVWETSSFETCEKTVQRYDLPEMAPAKRATPETEPAIPPSQMGDP